MGRARAHTRARSLARKHWGEKKYTLRAIATSISLFCLVPPSALFPRGARASADSFRKRAPDFYGSSCRSLSVWLSLSASALRNTRVAALIPGDTAVRENTRVRSTVWGVDLFYPPLPLSTHAFRSRGRGRGRGAPSARLYDLVPKPLYDCTACAL